MRGFERYNKSLEGLIIPVATTKTPYNPDRIIHKPTPKDPQGPIFEQIRLSVERGDRPFMSSPHHIIVEIQSLLRHHRSQTQQDTSGNSVLWFAERTYDGASVLPWDWDKEKDSNVSTSWPRLAKDDMLLDQLEERMRREVADSNKSFFLMYGFSFRDEYHPQGVAARSIQSQFPGHGHFTNSILHNLPNEQINLVSGETSIGQLASTSFFMDYGVQVAHEELHSRLAKFGGKDFSNQQYTWYQCGGKVVRHGHSFTSLKELLKQAVAFRHTIDPVWRRMVADLAKEYGSEFMFHFKEKAASLLSLSPSFGFSIFLPSPKEKKRMGLHEDDPHIWAVPGSLADAEVLVAGQWPNRVVEGPPSV